MGGVVVHDQRAVSSIGGHREGDLMLVAGHRQRLSEASDAVAAHLGSAAVGVPEMHHHVDRSTIGPEAADLGTGADDEAVGTETSTAIAQGACDGRIAVDRSVDVLEGHEEIVAQPVVLGDLHRRQSSSDSRRTASEFSLIVPSDGNHVMRGSRRNHRNWRRANWRVRMFAASRAASSGVPASR